MASFSDGVIAILITIMVLGLKPPQDATLESLRPLAPVFASYVLSFVWLGIYWNNHHHLLSVVDRVDGRTLWANLHLLFWLSLIPFGTSWVGQDELRGLAGGALRRRPADGCRRLLPADPRADRSPRP